LNLERRVARMIVGDVRLQGERDPGAERDRILREVGELGIGGVVFFGGLSTDVRSLIDQLTRAAGAPLIAAADLERGAGQQFGGATVLPTAMAIGATGIPDLAFAAGSATAAEARTVGINTVLAPVADLASEPSNPIVGTRSFGSVADRAGEFVAAFVRGCQEVGAAATVKHFPGHGATITDSHIELPKVGAGRAALESRELVPFRAAIDAGVRAVMTAHVAYEALDPGVPASLSRAVTTGVLRDELGFDGLVMTDALVMEGACGAADPVVASFAAGADVLLMPRDVGAAIGSLSAAVRSGRISEARIEESLARIDVFHAWLEGRSVAAPVAKPADVAEEIAAAAVTLVREGVGPIGPSDDSFRCVVVADTRRPVDIEPLREELGVLAPGVSVKVVRGGDRASVPEVPPASRTIVFVIDEIAAWRGFAGLSEPGRGLLIEIVRGAEASDGSGAIVVALGTPIRPEALPEGCGLVWAYDASPASQRAALRVVFGLTRPNGRPPFDLPEAQRLPG